MSTADSVFTAQYRENSIYLRVHDREAFNRLSLPAPEERVLDCVCVNDGEPLFFMITEGQMSVFVPEPADPAEEILIQIICDRPVSPAASE